MNCYDECKKNKKSCKVKECRLWIDYPKDLNCTEIAVQKNDKLVFREIGERLKLTPYTGLISEKPAKKMNTSVTCNGLIPRFFGYDDLPIFQNNENPRLLILTGNGVVATESPSVSGYLIQQE